MKHERQFIENEEKEMSIRVGKLSKREREKAVKQARREARKKDELGGLYWENKGLVR